MNEIKLHINTAGKPEDASSELFTRMEIPWEKSSNQVWEELSAKIDAMPATKQRRVIPMFYGLSAAAVIIILLAVTIFLRFYSTTISSLSGEDMTAQLPDGSTVGLNPGSSLSYHPYWWQFSRKISFEGEGFFNVEKGKKFEVASPLAKTIVLGTSFTIYSRNDEYRVSCFTGRVKVVSLKDGNVVLEPNERAVVGIDGSIVKHINHRNEPSNEKSDGNFIFTGASLSQVIDEIGRRYSVSITLKIEKEYFYTGNFTSEKPLNDVLDLVCKPFSLSFAKQADGSYMVFQNK